MHLPQEIKKGKIQAKNPNSDKDTAVTEEKERTYGIDCLHLGDPAVESENESEVESEN